MRQAMSNIWYVMKRELGAYFNSIVAYIVVILFLLITGALFWLNYFQQINTLSLRGFFQQAPLFLAFFAPAITMGLLAEEKRLGTLELLMTMPLSDFEIVMGKFLAAMGLLTVVFAMTLPYPITLSFLGDLDWGAVASGYIGLLLLGGAYSAIGLMASSWTRDQVVSILVAFSICFFLYLIDQLVGQPTGVMARVVEYMSTNSHFQNIARGVVDLRDVIYYLSVMAVSLVVAQVSVASRRWG
jgi:ABC-2 type transport system permease protein